MMLCFYFAINFFKQKKAESTELKDVIHQVNGDETLVLVQILRHDVLCVLRTKRLCFKCVICAIFKLNFMRRKLMSIKI